MPDRLSVFACWEKARQEFPDDSERRKHRYVELMRQEGHIVKRQSGQSRNLPCGWPHLPEPRDVDSGSSGPPHSEQPGRSE